MQLAVRSIYLIIASCCLIIGAHAAKDDVPLKQGNSSLLKDEALTESHRPATAREIRWARVAFDLTRETDCRRGYFTTERECRRYSRIEMSQVNIYIAEPSIFGRMVAVLPDGFLTNQLGVHDAFIALDLHPEANFAHLVTAFYVDIGVSEQWCDDEGGNMIENGVCMTRLIKKRCRHQRRNRRRIHLGRRCEVGFLPLVHYESDVHDGHPTQLLLCRSNIAEFAPCPIETRKSLPVCGQSAGDSNRGEAHLCVLQASEVFHSHRSEQVQRLRENSRDNRDSEAQHSREDVIRINTKEVSKGNEETISYCRVFETCDQAVMIVGGWNEWTLRSHQTDAMLKMYEMLRRHYVKRRHIKIFYADGNVGIEGFDDNIHGVHAAGEKALLRSHMRKLCDTAHCVDSLLLYLNNAADSEGNILLWDVNHDGKVSGDEEYLISELLADISSCQARQVTLIVDQGQSGELLRAIRKSRTHRNVVVMVSGRENDYASNSEFSRQWTQVNHTTNCIRDVFRDARRAIQATQSSLPEMYTGSEITSMTLFGAPCDAASPLTLDEIRQNYLGCLTLPTALWMKKIMSSSNEQ